ncbi:MULTISPECIES: polyphenol oxidase family protein [unclassified Frankia]|uniref:polyphenol oxidase family protein n=1 Tax=unclassified Frankia TaxID=2632575 RepID=UPI001EF6EF4E|nr:MULTISPECIES: polyphenol oxidase family protein [unclassified Frankia]
MTAGVAASRFRRTPSGLEVLCWPGFDDRLVDVFVTTRTGGVSRGAYTSLNLSLRAGDDDADVLANRATVAEALGATVDDFVFCAQAHSPNIAIVTDEHRGRGSRSASDALPLTDGLVTTAPGIALAVLAADCVPAVLHDPVAGVLACVHAGWRGTVRGAVPAALAAMRRLGAAASNVVAGVGPAIDPDRYQVGAEVVAAVRAAFDGRADEVIRADGLGKWTFDVAGANVMQLVAEGVPERQIHVAGVGTGPGTPFFSHRAENPCGRFAAVARLRGKDVL